MRAELTPARYLVLPLHGRLSPEEQQSVFLKSSKKQKIIFSTRIAETSVTIDQVKVVIDPGSDRINVYDQKNKISSFVLRPISQSAAKQRAGRAGRTTHGYCYRLYSE
jgi:HrpA-like RNA helicase